MPVPALASIARKYGLSLAQVESLWEQAKRQYGTDWRAVMGTVKCMAANASHSRRAKLK